MSIIVTSKMRIDRDAMNDQTIEINYEFDKSALKAQDGDRFVILFSLHNAADDSVIKHLGSDELRLADITQGVKLNFSANIDENILDINKGVNRIGKDLRGESVYAKIRVFKVDSEPAAVSKTEVLTGNFGPVGMQL